MRGREKIGQTLLGKLGVPLPTHDAILAIVERMKPKPEQLGQTKKMPIPQVREVVRPKADVEEIESTIRIAVPKSIVMGDEIVEFPIDERDMAMCIDSLPEREVRWLVPVPPRDTEIKQEQEILEMFEGENIVEFGRDLYFVSDDKGGFAGAKKVARTGNVIRVFPVALTGYELVGEEKPEATAPEPQKLPPKPIIEKQDLDLELLLAAEGGDLQRVEDLLDKGADVNVKDENGRTALMWAAVLGHVEMAELLIKRNARVDERTNISANGKGGWTALMMAAASGYNEVVELLVKNGAAVNAEDTGGLTASAFAFVEDHVDTLKILKKHGALISKEAPEELPAEEQNKLNTAFLDAVRIRDVKKLGELLGKGADVNAKDTVTGETGLMCASAKNWADVIEYLIGKGADVNIRDRDGRTALMYASSRKFTKAVRLLTEKGADVNAKDMQGKTALIHASEMGHHKIVKILKKSGAVETQEPELGPSTQDKELLNVALMDEMSRGKTENIWKLLDKGADVDAKDEKGWTPLFWAVLRGQTVMAQKLIDRGADVDARDSNEWTPLMWATAHDKIEMVRFLAEKGADVGAKNSNLADARSIALLKNREIVKILDYYGAKMAQKPKAKLDPIEQKKADILFLEAVRNGETGEARKLLEMGADINVRDVSHETALIIASKKGYIDLARLLIKRGADLEAKDKGNRTALFWASANEHFEIRNLLVEKKAQK